MASGPKTNRPPDDGSVVPSRPGVKVTPVPIPKPGVLPASQSVNQAPTVTRASGSSSVTPSTSASAVFGILAPADADLRDTAAGPHRDGRIRNPVPSKLKGKTDVSKGNFSVMHMEVVGRSEATERDAQAKRTSESTELAAKRAYESGYVALRRSRFVHVPDEVEPVKPFVPPAASVPAPNTTSRRSPLTAEETKSEQARLLTLLRSLHPVLVVDQICKALAFFGGIPAAPPPADGVFPSSAEANGSGNLFVGWISEIFPKLGGNSAQQGDNAAPQLISDVRQMAPPPEVVKRGRGRPKGSKATKVRKDKGIKKGPIKQTSGPASQVPASNDQRGDDSWVDVEDSLIVSDEVDANILLLAEASSPARLSASVSQPQALHQTLENRAAGQTTISGARTALAGRTAGDDIPADGLAAGKRRGRPKGSKNRPKGQNDPSSDTPDPPAGATEPQQFPQLANLSSRALHAAQVSQAIQSPAASSSFTAANALVASSTKKKVTKAKAAVQTPKTVDSRNVHPGTQKVKLANPSNVSSPDHAQIASVPASMQSNQPSLHQPYQTSQAFHPLAEEPVVQVPSMSNRGTKVSESVGQKRKRKGKDVDVLSNAQDQGSHQVSKQDDGLAATISANHAPTVATSSLGQPAGPPAAKRQRKGKDVKPPVKRPAQASTGAVGGASPPQTGAINPAITATHQIPNSKLSSGRLSVPTAMTDRHTESTVTPASASLESTITSNQSPQHGHFVVQSPTMENYEAQLQAQLEQQSESEPRPQPAQSQNRVGSKSRHMSNQHQHQHQPSVGQNRSPNPQPAQHIQAQTSSPLVTQQTQTQQPSYSQYRPSNSHFSQQHQQTFGTAHTQQGQTSQFTGQGQAAQVGAQATTTEQYSSSDPQSFSANQQYSSSQQQQSSQQRYQQQLATSTASTSNSYVAQHSPQYGSSTGNTFSSADGGYRASTNGLSAVSYAAQQRSQSGTPNAATTYRANGTHNLSHHSPSFGTAVGATQQRSTNVAHTSSQGLQGMTSVVQPYAANNPSDWSFLDAGGLDGSGQQGQMNMSNTSYGIGSANVRTTSNAGTGFGTNGLGSFDTSGLGNTDRFYVGRR